VIYNISGKKYRVVKRTFANQDEINYAVILQMYVQEWEDIKNFSSMQDAKHYLTRFKRMGGRSQVDEELDFGEI
jgi:hypothetical protein